MTPSLARGSVRLLAGGLLAVLLLVPVPLAAQTMMEQFGGFSANSDEPIDIESDSLEVFDAKKLAVFKGNVKAKQGTTELRARELHVTYSGEAATAATGQKKPAADPKGAAKPETQITRIEAKEKVLVSTDKDQSATSDWAVFDVKAQTVTIGGNVVLSQGDNVLRGERLVIDLKTNQSKFDTAGGPSKAPGRVKVLFNPKQGKDGKAKDGGEEAGKAGKAGKAGQKPQALAPAKPARPVP